MICDDFSHDDIDSTLNLRIRICHYIFILYIYMCMLMIDICNEIVSKIKLFLGSNFEI